MNSHAATMPIYQVMTSTPVTVHPLTTVSELLALFDRYDFNAFPVVAADGTLRGIVSKLDVLRLLHPDEQFRLPDAKVIGATRVAEIMRPGILTVEAEDPVVVAADLMVATGRRSLPRGSARQRVAHPGGDRQPRRSAARSAVRAGGGSTGRGGDRLASPAKRR
jgi:CBS domain-containing protein